MLPIYRKHMLSAEDASQLYLQAVTAPEPRDWGLIQALATILHLYERASS